MAEVGLVKWFNDSKGYGFIQSDCCPNDIFVHYTAISGDGFKTLAEGENVHFELVDGPKGPLATNVARMSPQEREKLQGKSPVETAEAPSESATI